MEERNNFVCPVCGKSNMTFKELDECISNHRIKFEASAKEQAAERQKEINELLDLNETLVNKIKINAKKLRKLGVDCSISYNTSFVKENISKKKCQCETNNKCNNDCGSKNNTIKKSTDEYEDINKVINSVLSELFGGIN